MTSFQVCAAPESWSKYTTTTHNTHSLHNTPLPNQNPKSQIQSIGSIHLVNYPVLGALLLSNKDNL